MFMSKDLIDTKITTLTHNVNAVSSVLLKEIGWKGVWVLWFVLEDLDSAAELSYDSLLQERQGRIIQLNDQWLLRINGK